MTQTMTRLKMINDKQKSSVYDMIAQNNNCQFLYTVDSMDDVWKNEGYLYCVSTSPDTYGDIEHLSHELERKGILNVIGGSYENGGGVGLQYEYTE